MLVQLGEKDTSHHGENVQRYFENGEWKTNLKPFLNDGKTSGGQEKASGCVNSELFKTGKCRKVVLNRELRLASLVS